MNNIIAVQLNLNKFRNIINFKFPISFVNIIDSRKIILSSTISVYLNGLNLTAKIDKHTRMLNINL
jgi:hypothetical protein